MIDAAGLKKIQKDHSAAYIYHLSIQSFPVIYKVQSHQCSIPPIPSYEIFDMKFNGFIRRSFKVVLRFSWLLFICTESQSKGVLFHRHEKVLSVMYLTYIGNSRI